jgi:predicted alpha/beta-hydrolase family hydrolase
LTNPTQLTVQVPPSGATTAILYRAERDDVGATLILAHGAGADQRSRWIVDYARALSSIGLDIVTFNFLYTEQHRRLPDRKPRLESCYRAVIEASRQEVASARLLLVIGGKSMGGRIATQVAAADPDLDVAGLVLLGYPLHPPGKPAERRDAHLAAVGRPMLFVQGSRDAFGTPIELAPVLETLAVRATLHIVEGGDHSFTVSRDRTRQAALHGEAQRAIIDWIRALRST